MNIWYLCYSIMNSYAMEKSTSLCAVYKKRMLPVHFEFSLRVVLIIIQFLRFFKPLTLVNQYSYLMTPQTQHQLQQCLKMLHLLQLLIQTQL